MKLAQGFLCSLLFGTMAQANEINLSWQWQSADGQQKHLQLTADERTFSASRHEMTQLDTALNFPLETLYSYISPRLYNSINQINQHSPETATKFRNLEQAFTLHDSSLESAQFWQAYRQYQEDAFTKCGSSPVHPANQKLPCVRPNYSQLFYQFKGDLKPWHSSFRPRISPPASPPVAGVAERHPHPARADGPLRSALAGPAGQQGRQRREGAAHGQSAGGAGAPVQSQHHLSEHQHRQRLAGLARHHGRQRP